MQHTVFSLEVTAAKKWKHLVFVFSVATKSLFLKDENEFRLCFINSWFVLFSHCFITLHSRCLLPLHTYARMNTHTHTHTQSYIECPSRSCCSKSQHGRPVWELRWSPTWGPGLSERLPDFQSWAPCLLGRLLLQWLSTDCGTCRSGSIYMSVAVKLCDLRQVP